VNCFKDTAQAVPVEILKIPPELERSAIERVRNYRSKRSEGATQDALRALNEGSKSDANLQALVLSAVKAGATLGEIADAMRSTFGLYQEYSGF
jgi:methylmalonyl-CoA mutase N-terminal domain/subunit